MVSSSQHPSAEDRLRHRGSGPDATVLGEATGHRLAPFVTPARLGRYVVVEQIGFGGMGRVLRAYDPKLRREVALKLLGRAAHEPDAAARIVREAQAMARLSHPNLVPVYDVDHDDDTVFIAMEYVDGTTLRGWLAATERSWRDIVGAFVAAGRGLAAAHAAGVVHRDFKPSNVMVGTDGRVRVMDFGLARGVGGGSAEGLEQVAIAALSSDLTQAGIVVGTPAFMAPEQHCGEGVGTASDQYAYCVALYEALFRVHAFTGADMDALVRAKQRGVPEPPRGPTDVPGWLRAAVVRGLAVEPIDRWPSMEALLAVLERGQASARRRRATLTLAAVSLVGAIAVLAVRLDLRARTEACTEAGASIAEVWNDDARATIRAASIATGLGYAATTVDKATPWIDAQAQAWQSARTEACLDADVRGVWSEGTLDRSLWCLDERRMELEALVAGLSLGDPIAVQQAVSAAAGLTTVETCRDAAVLDRLPPPPTERRDEVRAVLAQLSHARACEYTGEYAEGLRLARTASEAAEGLGWPPLAAAAHLHEANLLERQGAYAAAARSAEQAYFVAASIGAWDVAVAAASRLIFIVGQRLARHDAGLDWNRHAQLALAHVGDPEGLREADRLSVLAGVYAALGEYTRAQTSYERALALEEAAVGPDHPRLAAILGNAAGMHHELGDYERARVLLERTVAIREQAFGPDHPDVASALVKLANLHYVTGELEQARTLYDRGLAIQERALGPDHPSVANTLGNLAGVDYSSGEYLHARALQQRALAIREHALGPEHPEVAANLNNLARTHSAVGEHAEARVLIERALAIREKVFGPEHTEFASSLQNLAASYSDAGEYERALPLLRRVLAIHEKVRGPDHPSVAGSLANLAFVQSAMGDAAAALPLVERAVAIFDAHAGAQDGELGARFVLARALVATGGDEARARGLAEQARDGWRAGREPYAQQLAEVDEWLAAQR